MMPEVETETPNTNEGETEEKRNVIRCDQNLKAALAQERARRKENVLDNSRSATKTD